MAKSPASPSTPTVKPLAANPVKSKNPALKTPAEAIQPPIPVASSAPLTKPAAKVQEVAPQDAKAEKKRTGKVAKEDGNKSGETKEKTKKTKLVRDSFTMPEAEYAVLGDVKKACLKAGIAVKKSELLRVGVALIRQLDTAKLKEELDRLPVLKAGRPKKSKNA